jgi:hypothetical protein
MAHRLRPALCVVERLRQVHQVSEHHRRIRISIGTGVGTKRPERRVRSIAPRIILGSSNPSGWIR